MNTTIKTEAQGIVKPQDPFFLEIMGKCGKDYLERRMHSKTKIYAKGVLVSGKAKYTWIETEILNKANPVTLGELARLK